MLIPGRISWTVLTTIFSIFMLTLLYLSKKRVYVPRIREHPGIKAISEAIGRAVEMGKPIAFSPGIGSI